MNHESKLNKIINLFFSAKKYNSNSAWNTIFPLIEDKKNKRIAFYREFIRYAAIFIIVLTVGSIGYYIINPQSNKLHVEATEINEYREINLPDGTIVSLNDHSKLSFPEKFSNNREVVLEGEAFFEVIHNPEKPFIINAGNTLVQVLGTSFNINAYPELDYVEIIVKTGKVKFSINKSPSEINEIILNPGDKGIVLKNDEILIKSVNTNPNYISWKTHELIFDQTPLAEVFNSIEKTYNIKIKTLNPEIQQLPLSTTFKDQSIDYILEVICLTFGLNATLNNGQYEIELNENA